MSDRVDLAHWWCDNCGSPLTGTRHSKATDKTGSTPALRLQAAIDQAATAAVFLDCPECGGMKFSFGEMPQWPMNITLL